MVNASRGWTAALSGLVVPPSGRAARTASTTRVKSNPYRANPQRQWVDGAIKEYFLRGRNEAELWREFNARVTRSTVERNRDTLITNGESLLDEFLALDRGEAESPAAAAFFRTPDLPWRGHTLNVPPHLLYLKAGRYRLRQLWTDRDLAAGAPVARLMAAAVRLCSEGQLGPGSSAAVEVWQLRLGMQKRWDDDDLMWVEDELEYRLDAVAADLGL